MVSVKEPKPAHATEAAVTTHGTVRLLTAWCTAERVAGFVSVGLCG